MIKSIKYSSVIKVFDDAVFESLKQTRAIAQSTIPKIEPAVDTFVKQTATTPAKSRHFTRNAQCLNEKIKKARHHARKQDIIEAYREIYIGE